MTMKAAKAYADREFSLFIRWRDVRCVTCGEPTTDCSHVFRRHNMSTRWDVRNAYGQCRSCHFKHHNKSEYPLLKYAEDRLGARGMAQLEEDYHCVSHLKADQVKLIGDKYKEIRGGGMMTLHKKEATKCL